MPLKRPRKKAILTHNVKKKKIKKPCALIYGVQGFFYVLKLPINVVKSLCC
jgi:hypothetical protein